VKSIANMQSIEISRALESWYSRPSGEELCVKLCERIQPILDMAFGYHILQVGPLPARSLIASSPINHRFYASEADTSATSLLCHPDELPLESDSVDALVAFHALEFDEHPHGSLREMLRVLRPYGHLVIVGFNPYSLLGVSQYLRGMRSNSLWHHAQHHPVSAHRLTDWLSLLDCELESIEQLFPIPLMGAGRVHQLIADVDRWAMRHNLPGGSVYIAHAIKQIAGVRRPRPVDARAPRRLPGLSVAGAPAPTPRQPRKETSDLAA
jgi:SAM-dependent methyltransferase